MNGLRSWGGYAWLILKRTQKDTWLFIRGRLAISIVSAVLTVLAAFIAPLRQIFSVDFPRAAFGPAIVLALVILVYLFHFLRAPVQIHLEQLTEREDLKTQLARSESDISQMEQRLQVVTGFSGILAPDLDAWAAVNYIVDEVDLRKEKDWDQVVTLLRWAARDNSNPLKVWGKRDYATHEDEVPPDTFADGDLVIQQGG